MSASTAPAAKAALLARIQADATILAGPVQVTYGDPGSALTQESVWFERTLLAETAAALGQQRRNEAYTLELVVFVAQDGDDAQACEERCWTLVGAVENMLRPPLGPGGAVSANLGGAVNLHAQFAGCDMEPGIAPKGGQRVAIATCRIACQSRK